MVTSSNWGSFCVIGPLCGEFTGHRLIPIQRTVTRSFDVFFNQRLNKRLSKQSWDWLYETPSRPLWRHCNGFVKYFSDKVANSILRCHLKQNSKCHCGDKTILLPCCLHNVVPYIDTKRCILNQAPAYPMHIKRLLADKVTMVWWHLYLYMGLLPDTQNCGLGMLREWRERFTPYRGLAIPTCITARASRTCPRSMPGSLTSDCPLKSVATIKGCDRCLTQGRTFFNEGFGVLPDTIMQTIFSAKWKYLILLLKFFSNFGVKYWWSKTNIPHLWVNIYSNRRVKWSKYSWY